MTGFPKDTPIAHMTDKEQAAYWKHKARKHETINERLNAELYALRGSPGNEEVFRGSPENLDAQQATELDAELAAARAEGEQQARTAMAAQLVRAEFRAAAPGLAPEALDSYLEDLNLTRYVDEHGTVDTARVAAKAQALTGGRPGFQGHTR